MLRRIHIAIVGLMVAGAAGCSLLSNKTEELVLAPTEVGTPVGEKTTKAIGPAGGTLSSADGRLKLTVPQGAVAQNVTFAIQPITNKAANGLGNAYRLEPDGTTFATPVEVSIRYDDTDLEETVPEALSVAYQDKQGSWHAQMSARLDQAGKTITIATKHFTDVAAWARLMLRPVEARVRVGHSQSVALVQCPEPGLIDWLRSRPLDCSAVSPNATVDWQLRGAGTLESTTFRSVINYRAPARKPPDNIAWVHVRTRFGFWDPETGGTTEIERTLAAKMIIVDRGYKATGSWGGLTWSGTVCDFQKPFNILGQARFLTFVFRFTPSPDGASGTVGVAGGGSGVTLHNGNGTYTVSGIDTDSPRIALTMESFKGSYPGVGTAEGSGTRYIDLVPLDTNECDGQ